jgi:RNA polymerase sigma-70 factor (ECF subfamily)
MVSSLVAKEAISCDDGVRSLAGEVECTDSDFALVDRIRANDALAFDELVDKYRVRLFSVIYNMTSNKDDAFDLMQDVFIKVYRNIGKFNKKSSFFSWLYRIAVNTVITHINKSRLKRFFNLEELDEDGVKDFCIDGLVERNDARRDIFLKELHENLNIALQKLSNKHRVVVVLCEIEGLSSAEAAEILKCSEGTVRSRLHYAKEQLKGYLNKYLG